MKVPEITETVDYIIDEVRYLVTHSFKYKDVIYDACEYIESTSELDYARYVLSSMVERTIKNIDAKKERGKQNEQ